MYIEKITHVSRCSVYVYLGAMIYPHSLQRSCPHNETKVLPLTAMLVTLSASPPRSPARNRDPGKSGALRGTLTLCYAGMYMALHKVAYTRYLGCLDGRENRCLSVPL